MKNETDVPIKPQAIVMPFVPETEGSLDRTGLALHFLLSNVLVLNHKLREMWFGWRVGKIFPDPNALKAYCLNRGPQLDCHLLAREQNLRFWLTGTFTARDVLLTMTDTADDGAAADNRIAVATEDGLIGFRTQFIQWTDKLGLEFEPHTTEKVLWREEISAEGLKAVGEALIAFYLYSGYGQQGNIDLAPFEEAVRLSPESFMTQDLMGWAFYRGKNYPLARAAFLKALHANPAGIGVMAGLMWCGVMTQNGDDAYYWAARKAEVCKEDMKAALEKTRRLLKKYASGT